MMPTDSPMDPAISVIIPAYGVAKYIAEAIDSVLAQSFQQFEIVVVNDGSPDTASMDIAMAPYLADSRIRYISQENQGVSAARNNGIRAAKAPLIAVLDGDDTLRPDALETWLEIMRRNNQAGMAYGNAVFFGGTALDGQDWMTHFPSCGSSVTYEDLITRRANSFGCSMFRRAVLLEIGLYDESVPKAEDYDLALRIAKSGAAIENTKKVIYNYRLRPESLTHSVDIRVWRIRVLEKHRNRPDLKPSEAAAIAGELRYQHAALALEDSKIALRSGDYALARAKFREANPGGISIRRIFISAALLIWPAGLRWFTFRRETRSR